MIKIINRFNFFMYEYLFQNTKQKLLLLFQAVNMIKGEEEYL